jgi:NADH-quinone oxidoreductase subunit M
MYADWPLLSLVIWTPIFGGILVLFAGDQNSSGARKIALVVSLITFLLTLPLYTQFNTSTHLMQFVERREWIGVFNIEYYLGIDGISMPLILLTSFTTVIVIISAWEVIQYRVSQYLAAFLIMEGFMFGTFAALDSILFYIFFEAMLIPMFLIIGVWGGANRIYATLKFFLYTFIGSVLMLVALIAFLVAFAVKVPMWPVHTWLPDAHVEAPTGGSVILAAIMLKIGGYGFLRFSLPITPDASAELDWLIITMSLTAVVYIGFVALVQRDMKKLIAYSSIAHMGFVTLGFFIVFRIFDSGLGDQGAALALEGGMVQMVSHGFISGAMFLCVGVLYDRMHSRQIADYGGVANTMPVFAAFMVFFAMANAGLPGTSGFVGEFMVILASFKASFWIAFLAALTLILGAAYTLWMIKRVIYGEIANDNVRALNDINKREFLFLALLALAVLGLGLWPDPLVEVMHPTIDNLLNHIANTKI